MMKYKCPKCEWVGTEKDMDADCFSYTDEEGNYEDEVWSNWICPSCGTWHQLEDYLKVEE
jgi:predicted RNA-binding Zn-ribbon protein involved in translation (DUF1610 family)